MTKRKYENRLTEVVGSGPRRILYDMAVRKIEHMKEKYEKLQFEPCTEQMLHLAHILESLHICEERELKDIEEEEG